LISAGNAVYGNDLLSFGEALLFFARPFDPRHGGGRGKEELQRWGGMAVAPQQFGGENGYMRQILEGKQNEWRELPFLWPTPRARSTFRAFFFRPESPTAPRKAGDGLGSPDGLTPYSGGKRGTGGAVGPNNAVRMKKGLPGASSGETAGDALGLGWSLTLEVGIQSCKNTKVLKISSKGCLISLDLIDILFRMS
jgi:hypothetical protein